MAAFATYSATPASNTTIGGLNVTENNTAVASLNNVAREIVAEGRQLYDLVAAIGSPLLLTGGTLTGDINRQGRGGYLSSNNASYTAPQVYYVVTGGSAPSSPPNGSLIFYHAA